MLTKSIKIKISNVMRNILVLICLFVLSSQNVLHAMVQDWEDVKWDMFHNQDLILKYLVESENGEHYLCFGTSSYREKTIPYEFNGKEYLKFILTIRKESPTSKTYYYREEGLKLYRYNEEKQKEELILDYGLDVGDEFKRPDGVLLRVVELRDTLIHEADGLLRVLCLEGVDDKSVKDVWVESFGSIHFGIMLPNDMPEFCITDLLYIEKLNIGRNIETTLSRGFYNQINKDYLLGIYFRNEDLTENNEGAKEVLTGESPSYRFKNRFSNYYKLTYCCLFITKGDSLILYTTPCGDYLNAYSSGGKNCIVDLILNFPSGNYSLYNTSGNFIQNLTIGGDADVIGSIENDAFTSKQGNGSLFDLTGRSLSTVPQHGIYIQNGRKVLK